MEDVFQSHEGNYKVRLPQGAFRIYSQGEGDLSLVDAAMPVGQLFRNKVDFEFIVDKSMGSIVDLVKQKITAMMSVGIQVGDPAMHEDFGVVAPIQETTYFPGVGYGGTIRGVRVGMFGAREWNDGVLLYLARIATDDQDVMRLNKCVIAAWKTLQPASLP